MEVFRRVRFRFINWNNVIFIIFYLLKELLNLRIGNYDFIF